MPKLTRLNKQQPTVVVPLLYDGRYASSSQSLFARFSLLSPGVSPRRVASHRVAHRRRGLTKVTAFKLPPCRRGVSIFFFFFFS